MILWDYSKGFILTEKSEDKPKIRLVEIAVIVVIVVIVTIVILAGIGPVIGNVYSGFGNEL